MQAKTIALNAFIRSSTTASHKKTKISIAVFSADNDGTTDNDTRREILLLVMGAIESINKEIYYNRFDIKNTMPSSWSYSSEDFSMLEEYRNPVINSDVPPPTLREQWKRFIQQRNSHLKKKEEASILNVVEKILKYEAHISRLQEHIIRMIELKKMYVPTSPDLSSSQVR